MYNTHQQQQRHKRFSINTKCITAGTTVYTAGPQRKRTTQEHLVKGDGGIRVQLQPAAAWNWAWWRQVVCGLCSAGSDNVLIQGVILQSTDRMQINNNRKIKTTCSMWQVLMQVITFWQNKATSNVEKRLEKCHSAEKITTAQ